MKAETQRWNPAFLAAGAVCAKALGLAGIEMRDPLGLSLEEAEQECQELSYNLSVIYCLLASPFGSLSAGLRTNGVVWAGVGDRVGKALTPFARLAIDLQES